jgi:hypothetical protein
MPDLLLMTKVRLPIMRRNLVPRKKVLKQLDEGIQDGHLLTLVSAPAGYGKTTTVRMWVEGAGYPVAWLTLEKSDNDLKQFLTYFLTALGQAKDELGHAALELVENAQEVDLKRVLEGRVTQMYTDLMPEYTSVKLDWYETARFNLALALGCILVFLSMIAVATIRLIRSRHSGNRKPAPRGAREANGVILGICILNLLFLVGAALWGNPISELQGLSLMAKIVLGLGVLSAVLTVGAPVYALLAWKHSYWGIAARVYYTLVTVAAVAFLWFLNYWSLLGWRF